MKFFKEDVINVFCDASVKKSDEDTLACPGCLITHVSNNNNINILREEKYIIKNATNNIGELSAILLGLETLICTDYKGKTINLFSDSLISIKSIREWIFEWIKHNRQGVLYSSSCEIIKNQEIIKDIINIIYYNNIRINLYHQKGHVSSTPNSQNHALNVFYNSNNINIDMEELQLISNYNNIIDKKTKECLENNMENMYRDFYNNKFQSLHLINMKKYRKLIGK